jgi:hypothetical protein
MFYSLETFSPTQKGFVCVLFPCIVDIDPEELLLKFLGVLRGKSLDRGKG